MADQERETDQEELDRKQAELDEDRAEHLARTNRVQNPKKVSSVDDTQRQLDEAAAKE